MNPSKRKKLYRKELAEQAKEEKVKQNVEEKVALPVVEEIKKEESTVETNTTQLSGILKKKKVVNDPV